MPKGARNNKNKGKEVCRRLTTTDKDNVTYSGEGSEATTNHEENNYGLFSLSADVGTAQGSNLLLYITIGLAILGMYLQYKTWKANRTTKRILKGGKSKPSLIPKLLE